MAAIGAVQSVPSADVPPINTNSQPTPDGPPSLVSAQSHFASESANPVVRLAHKYRAEFEETLDRLRQRALKLQATPPQLLISETQARIEPYKQDFVSTVQALDDVGTPSFVVLQTFAWASVLVFAANISSYVSAYFLIPVLSYAVAGFAAGLFLALAAVPAYAYYAIQNDLTSGAPDVTIRFRLLTFAVVQGLLVGFILQDSNLSGAPSPAVLLAIIAVTYPFVAGKFGGNRLLLLSGSVGVSVGVTLVLGVLLGYLTLPYLVLTTLYGTIAAVTLQYLYKNVSSETVPTYQYQLVLLIAFTAANLDTHLIFGMNAEAYAKYKHSMTVQPFGSIIHSP